MLFGDLSNKQAPIIAFNVDNLLFEPVEEEKDMFSLVAKLIFPKARKINIVFVESVNKVWDAGYTVYLVTNKTDSDLLEIIDILDDNFVNYTNLKTYTGIDNLRRMINYRFMYYVDSDEVLLSRISAKNAINIKDIKDYIF